MKMPPDNRQQIGYSLIIFFTVLCSFTGSAHGTARCGKILYEGKGAGEVVFDATAHAAKGLTCADCHEPHVFTPALFVMKKGANSVSMTRMERGWSCGSCHDVSATNTFSCSRCHHK
jgi:c(7)-type cytochrome triheme protein